jgi:hypothetical protein
MTKIFLYYDFVDGIIDKEEVELLEVESNLFIIHIVTPSKSRTLAAIILTL